MSDVKAIVDQAVTHDGYVPDVGQKIAVLLDVGPNLQPLLIGDFSGQAGKFRLERPEREWDSGRKRHRHRWRNSKSGA
jgi:hypothetical protein